MTNKERLIGRLVANLVLFTVLFFIALFFFVLIYVGVSYYLDKIHASPIAVAMAKNSSILIFSLLMVLLASILFADMFRRDLGSVFRNLLCVMVSAFAAMLASSLTVSLPWQSGWKWFGWLTSVLLVGLTFVLLVRTVRRKPACPPQKKNPGSSKDSTAAEGGNSGDAEG